MDAVKTEAAIEAIKYQLDAGDGRAASGALAGLFGWATDKLRHREITQAATHLDVTRGFLGYLPAAVFATATKRNGLDPLQGAALYAYHASTRWGVLADKSGVTVFNSHWLADEQWFRLPTIAWAELKSDAEVLDALTPSGLAEGWIDRLATRRKAPSEVLQPVDDELVERLDKWRDEALRYARKDEGIDEKLQILFAQFFVLRTVEDRQLNTTIPPLETTLTRSDEVDRARFQRIFALARKIVGSELFDIEAAERLPPHVVAGVIRDLYTPHPLPMRSLRYNFAWIESDVLGHAYEKYLSTVLKGAPTVAQMELFLSLDEKLNVLVFGGVQVCTIHPRS